MHQNVFQDGTRRQLRARAPAHPSGELLGQPCIRGAHLDAAPLRQDHLRVDVRRRHALQRAQRRAQHLLYLQAHLTEAPAQCCQVLHGHREPVVRIRRLPRHPPELRGDRAEWTQWPLRRAHRQRECSQLQCMQTTTDTSVCQNSHIRLK